MRGPIETARRIYDYERHPEHHRTAEERYHDLCERILIADRAMREGNHTVLRRVLSEAVRETGRTRLEAREDEG